ncbi:hypothetical protein T09_13387 [Trichinella sp. T9]|nr:hypothetical protein T09_13387 [Trichinella sp. T9]
MTNLLMSIIDKARDITAHLLRARPLQILRPKRHGICT